MELKRIPDEYRKRKIFMTNHARERLEQMGIEFKQMLYLVYNGFLDKPIKSDKYKREKYGDVQNEIMYIRNESYIFTVRDTKKMDGSGEDILLLITATDQRDTLSCVPTKVEIDTNFSWGDSDNDRPAEFKYNKGNKGNHGRPKKAKGSIRWKDSWR